MQILRRRGYLFLGVFLGVMGCTAIGTFLIPTRYRGEFQILVAQAPNLDQDKAGLSGGADDQTQVALLGSPTLLQAVSADLVKTDPDLNPEILQAGLVIRQQDQTRVLEVSYRAADPQQIKRVLDTLAKHYLEVGKQQQRAIFDQGLQFIEAKLPPLEAKLQTLRQALEQFQQRHGFADPQIQGQEVANLIQAIEKQHQEAQVQLREAQALATGLQEQLGYESEEVLAVVNLTESERYQDLLDQIRAVETTLATDLTRFKEDAPVIQVLREKRQNLLVLLEQEAAQLNTNPRQVSNLSSLATNLGQQLVNTENRIRMLQIRLEALAQVRAELEETLVGLPPLAREFANLQQQLQTATHSLDLLSNTREQLQLEAAQAVLPWRIIAQPQLPSRPVIPNWPLNLGLGAGAGLMLGLGVVWWVEKGDRPFYSPLDLQANIHLPLLGIIPHQTQQALETSEGQRTPLLANHDLSLGEVQPFVLTSPLLEAFRVLHANLCLLATRKQVGSLVITSALSGDGKSTVALNLAKTAASLGQRVLLIDGDLRRPQVHQDLALENLQGLTTLVTTAIDPAQVIQRVMFRTGAIASTLDVLTAGPLPLDATKLLASTQMVDLMQAFHASYDLVIYDTPAIMGLVDARLLAARTDGLILVVGLDQTDNVVLRQTLDSLEAASIPIIGMVANGLRAGGDRQADWQPLS